jgi:hypothetical protein
MRREGIGSTFVVELPEVPTVHLGALAAKAPPHRVRPGA